MGFNSGFKGLKLENRKASIRMGDRVIIGCGGSTKTDGKINKQELSIF